jgi:putative hydrolase of HD superfamily
MSIDLPKLLIETNRRLSDITRFNITPRINNESVAEHCYYVAFYAMIFARFVPEVDVLKVLKMSLLHDVEEVISSDFPHSTKMKYPEFTQALESMNLTIASEILQNDQEYISLWEESRNLDTEESRLVFLCDKVSVLLYARDETNLGNKFMSELLKGQKESIVTFIEKYPKYDFVKSLLTL